MKRKLTKRQLDDNCQVPHMTKVEKVEASFNLHIIGEILVFMAIVFLAFHNHVFQFIVRVINETQYRKLIIAEMLASFIVILTVCILQSFHLIHFKWTTKKLKQTFSYVPTLFGIMAILFISCLLTPHTLKFQDVVGIIILCIFIGIFEEMLYRGLVIQLLKENLNCKYKNAIIILVSGVIFGISHVSNLQTVTVATVIMQVLQATASGMLFASLYLYTNDIVSLIIIHGTYDFLVFMNNNGIIYTSTELTVENLFATFVFCGLYLWNTYVLYQKLCESEE